MTQWVIAVAMACSVGACSSAPDARQLGQDAAAAMGGLEQLRGVNTLVMSGGQGVRYRLGQTVRVTDAEEPAKLSNVVETLDFANGRAALDYEVAMASGFRQHRQEILTKKGDGDVGLENVEGRPLAVMSGSGLFSWGTQNHPEIALRRNVIAVALAAAESPSTETPQDRELDGRPHAFSTVSLPSGESIGVYYDPESKLIGGFEATDTETMLGDVPAQYVLADYRAAGGVQIPHKITIRKAGQPYAEVQFGSAAVNDPAALALFEIPVDAAAEADKAAAEGDYSPVTLTKVADGVLFARAYSHNSMVVEFPSFLAVVEAPYTEAQSKTLVRMLQAQFPNKPIRYAAVTHHHFDHTGGVRGLAAAGATILTERGHEVALRSIVESPHSNPADELETKRRALQTVGALEVFDGTKVITDGGQTLELYAITGNPHVDPKVIAYVPTSRVLFQSDIWIPGVGAPASPDAVHLLESVRQLNLRVDTNVGGHGGIGPFAELVKAAAAATATASN
jgi:glyoxylase-like metal-dependent hydrolase (beta-lactamase superfamily II)